MGFDFFSLRSFLRLSAGIHPIKVIDAGQPGFCGIGVQAVPSADRGHFLQIASGSARKCGAILDILGRCGVLDAESLETGKQLLVRIVAMLTRMIERGHGGALREEEIVCGYVNEYGYGEETGKGWRRRLTACLSLTLYRAWGIRGFAPRNDHDFFRIHPDFSSLCASASLCEKLFNGKNWISHAIKLSWR